MNKARRKRVIALIEQFNLLQEELEDICNEETECLDNMPESFQETERYEKVQENVDNLNEALNYLEDIIDYLDNARQ